MKLGPVTKLGKKNTSTSKKKIDDGLMSKDCNVIAFFFDLPKICSYQEAGFRTHGL